MTSEFRRRMRQIEEAIRTVESAPDPHLRATSLDLIRGVMELHGMGLERMIQVIAGSGETGRSLLQQLAADECSASLLLLYGLHPVNIETRVKQALEKVSPYMKSHGGSIELIGVAENVIKLRLSGACKTCPSSRMTLDLAVEQAIYEMAPDAAGIEVEGMSATPGSPLLAEQAQTKTGAVAAEPVWETVSGLDALAPGAMETRQVDGRTILFCRLDDDTLYAYDGFCTACAARLEPGGLAANAIVCGSCGQRYDVVQAGRAIDRQDLRLAPFPILHDRSEAKIALPAQT